MGETSEKMLRLEFFEPDESACLRKLQSIEGIAERRIVLINWNEFAANLVREAGNGMKFACLKRGAEVGGVPSVDRLEDGDVLVANEFQPEALSEQLLACLDAESLTVVAPTTPHYFRNRPLFLISIPKSGTHLLYRLAESLGYKAGITHNGDPKPGRWYCVEYSNSHTVAKDFFIDSTRRAPFGNRHHPFPRTPTMFIYRNPLDIVVSEANYYHRDGATIFSSYLRHLEFEQRLLRLIDDPYLLGSIRDRINGFVPWFDFENVIPVSFEELIGSKGGGSDVLRTRLIWSLQLKLHIPGDPANIGNSLFDERSPTFREGRIGAYREQMSQEALAKFFTLDQDFMHLTGYADAFSGSLSSAPMPQRAEEFRRRPMRVSAEDFKGQPINVGWNFLAHNLVRFNGRYFAIPIKGGAINLQEEQVKGTLNKLISRRNLDALKVRIAATWFARSLFPRPKRK